MTTPETLPPPPPAGPTAPSPTLGIADFANPGTAVLAAPTTTDGIPVGKPVKFEDVFKYFSPKCKTCNKGMITGTRRNPATNQWYRFTAACKCANNRFFKAHPEVIEDPKTHECFWPPESK